MAVNSRHADFPSMLAEALDVLSACNWDVSLAAESLRCTGSQLVKLLKDEPRALALLNREREERGLRALN